MFRTPMTLDRGQRAMTGVVAVIIAVALGATVLAGAHIGVSVVAVLGVVLALAWAMSPRAIVVDGGELRVERRAWPPLRIPLASVASAAPLERLSRGTLRLFGVGGFFGSYGLFSNGDLGRFRLYATRAGQAMIVRRTGDALPLVLTPDDVAGAIGAIDRRPLLTE
ncbi:MAG TPA: PH domain-containing protein [Polyangiaceae bacterium]